MSDLGDKLRECRKAKHYTLRQVYELTGVSYSNLAEVERGDHSCNADTLKTLAELYGVSTDYLLGSEKSSTSQLTGIQLALYDGTKDLSDEQLLDILNYANYVKYGKK